MWKYTKPVVIVATVAVFLLMACQKEIKQGYSYHPGGFYYQLLSFHTDSSSYQPDHVALVNAVFKTQADSVFWDSFNDLNDRLFIKIDSNAADPFRRFVSTCTLLDSASLLVPTRIFFAGQFKSDSVPFFSKQDSIVKINFKIKAILSSEDFKKLAINLLKEEQERIKTYFKTDQQLELAQDASGFYWINRPEPSENTPVENGDLVTIAYEGSFLNGRFLERSGANFEFVYGTPDQLLKGLNYVIGKLKKDQTAKILLSSRLAFGESGSSNGIVPPCTPLIYKIKIIDVKKTK